MYRVDGAICTGCGDCIEACPAGAISLVNGRARIDGATCADCGSCADACPQGAITMIVASGGACAASESERPTAVAPVAAAPAGGLRARPDVALLPAEAQRSRIWPLVGGALVWAARELLPEVLTAWRASSAGVLRSVARRSMTFGQVASQRRCAGYRHRWGRV